PSAGARDEQCTAVSDIADWCCIGPAGAPPGEGQKHQSPTHDPMEARRQDSARDRVEVAHDPLQDPAQSNPYQSLDTSHLQLTSLKLLLEVSLVPGCEDGVKMSRRDRDVARHKHGTSWPRLAGKLRTSP